jgi:hypothetical protein
MPPDTLWLELKLERSMLKDKVGIIFGWPTSAASLGTLLRLAQAGAKLGLYLSG